MRIRNYIAGALLMLAILLPLVALIMSIWEIDGRACLTVVIVGIMLFISGLCLVVGEE